MREQVSEVDQDSERAREGESKRVRVLESARARQRYSKRARYIESERV